MMQLATITSFVVLLCGFFGTTTANDDQNTITGRVARSINGLSNSCIFGVKAVSMVLFTSDHPNGTLVQKNESFCKLFDNTRPVFIMTHGFIASSRNYNFSDLALALLKEGYTVFSLDWDDASCYNDLPVVNLGLYPFAVHNTREVGDHLASYIKTIVDECLVPLKSITLMGHSLGAHISGFAAKNLTDSNYGKILLLIGTDPAAPGFIFEPGGERFSRNDAERVVALHTSGLGLQTSLGHLDLWINNGFCQSACGVCPLVGGGNVNCSHNIAIPYLITMINNCVYTGVPVSERIVPLPRIWPGCSSNENNCIAVDNRIIDSNYTATGDYCVSVTSEYPYCTKNNFKCQK